MTRATRRLLVLFVLCAACGSMENNEDGSNQTSNNTSNTVNNSNSSNNTNNTTTTTTNTSNNTNANTTDTGCGDVTDAGACDGAIRHHCEDGELVVDFDCTGQIADRRAVCADMPGTGPTCAIAETERCQTEDPLSQHLCGASEPTCLYSSTGLFCASTTQCSDDMLTWLCDGPTLTMQCVMGQALSADCASLGGTCDPTGCVNIVAGGRCDPFFAYCAAGLTCNNPDGELLGTCG